jgi:hypothetical protein
MPAKVICEALEELCFKVISVKQMFSNCRKSPDGGPKSTDLPVFLVTLARKKKSQEMFKLTGLCHISIKSDTPCKSEWPDTVP